MQKFFKYSKYEPCTGYVLVAQACLTLCKPLNCSLLGISVYGILEARILEWVPLPSPGDLLNTRDRTCVSWQVGFFTSAAAVQPEKPILVIHIVNISFHSVDFIFTLLIMAIDKHELGS